MEGREGGQEGGPWGYKNEQNAFPKPKAMIVDESGGWRGKQSH